MKTITKIKLLLFLSTAIIGTVRSQVGVNILVPHKSAAMQVEAPTGTAKGLLTPSMTTAQRMSVTSGTNVAADGLVVYDIQHRMHYYYNGASNRWTSMSPLTLSTPTVGSNTIPSGVITTPSSTAIFSLGINKQNPTQALDVVGNATVSGNVNVGGNLSATGSVNVNGTLTVPGFPINALVPAGIIVMWSGTLIPVGWAVCDGGTYNGLTTPDLRGRFIVGINSSPGAQYIPTGQYVALGVTGLTPIAAPTDGTTVNYGAIGNTGGENGHILSKPEIPQHQHSLQGGVDNCTSAISTTAVQDDTVGFTSTNPNMNNGSGGGQRNDANNGKSHSHSLSGNSGDGTTSGLNGIVHENRPPYYVLAYIIKLP